MWIYSHELDYDADSFGSKSDIKCPLEAPAVEIGKTVSEIGGAFTDCGYTFTAGRGARWEVGNCCESVALHHSVVSVENCIIGTAMKNLWSRKVASQSDCDVMCFTVLLM